VEAVEWPDSCLGIQDPDVMCMQVITPGYRVILNADGTDYEYHTNADGTEALLAVSAEQTVVAQVVEAAAVELQVSASVIEVVSVEAVEWPDSCLGVTSADTMCAMVITPGYRVVLNVEGQEVEYHTNEDGSEIVAATPEA
jgi:hypothetical protein